MFRFIKTALLATALTAVAAATSGAQAQGPCLPHEDAVSKLAQSYGEQKVGLGMGPNGGMVYELYVGESGSWTILVTRPNGVSCIAASGDNWMTTPMLIGDPA